MFARLMSTKVMAEHIPLYRTIFTEEMMPMARLHEGLIHIMLLEPLEKGGEMIAVMEWDNQADAQRFERSGGFEEVYGKLIGLAAKEPVLKTYSVETVGATRPDVHRPHY